MRFHLLGLVLIASVASPAIAQRNDPERRIERLEQEMRAVQRRVFPSGQVGYVEPEIRPEAPQGQLGGMPAGSAVADLSARLDALERQLAAMTGQAEESAFRTRQLEQAFERYRGEAEGRMNRLERDLTLARSEPVQPAAPAAATPIETAATTTTPAAAPATGDAAEDAYLTGFRLWEQKRYADAQKVLEEMAAKHPRHRRASWARNLAGRAYLDEGKPATAAKVFLANYQADPKGERAADSLYFLGQALFELKRPAEACKVYDELQDVYGTGMRDWLRQRLPQARRDAKCS